MPRKTSPSDLERIVAVVSGFPSGAPLEQIAQALDPPPPRRTLQRWLRILVDDGRLTLSGRGRASRYRAATRPITAVVDGIRSRVTPLGGELTSPFSEIALEIRDAVRRPVAQRRPVGYTRGFLENYRPNETHYLSGEARRYLLQTGRSESAVDRPAGTYARQLLDRLLIDLSWNSSRLEGNTYSLLETERLIAWGEAAEGKDAREAQMILNHKAAIEFLVEQAEDIGFNRYTILNLHALLSNNLLGDPAAGGRLRSAPVHIAGSVFEPLQNPQVIEECFDRLLETATAIEDPFEQAVFTTVQLPYLQPFIDVNKRVARLAANIPLIKHNLCPLSFIDVPEDLYVHALLGVYELNRVELVTELVAWAYDRSAARYSAIRQSLGEPDRFRLQHREPIREIMHSVVAGRMNREQAVRAIGQFAEQRIATPYQARFREVVETEIMALHEGNIARYQIRPSEYRLWRAAWS